MGSDGLWDVVSNDEARSLIQGVKDPCDASKMLVKLARRRREDAAIKIDDITCLVVDINPQAQKSSNATSMPGCSCAIS